MHLVTIKQQGQQEVIGQGGLITIWSTEDFYRRIISAELSAQG